MQSKYDPNCTQYDMRIQAHPNMNVARNHTQSSRNVDPNKMYAQIFGTWREAVRAGFAAAAAASPASPLLPAANMPLPVISFHLGAEHGFLEERSSVIRGESHINQSIAPRIEVPRARAREEAGTGSGEQSDLLVRLSASSSVTWPPNTTFLIASDGCAQRSDASF